MTTVIALPTVGYVVNVVGLLNDKAVNSIEASPVSWEIHNPVLFVEHSPW